MFPLRWTRHPNLLGLPTAGNGSCLLHSIVQGFDTTYQAGRNPDGTPFNRESFVRIFRNELADLLSKPSNSEDPNSPTWYDRLSRGTLEDYAEAVKNVPDTPDLSREGFAAHLRSSNWLGHEAIELVSSVLGIAVFILFEEPGGNIRGPYVLGKDADLYYRGYERAVLIVSHQNRHFSTVGRREADNTIRTCFTMDDPLIREIMIESIGESEAEPATPKA